MSSSSISDISYTYPIPQVLGEEETSISISELKNSFNKWFSDSNGTFLKIRDNLLSELNTILGKSIVLNGNKKYDHLNFASFVSQYANYPNDCTEAINAFKFYGNQIVWQINKLTDYIKQANEILKDWDTLKTNGLSNQEISDLIHKDVIDLECLMNFSLEIEKIFSPRYIYDFDEDTWKPLDDDYSSDALNESLSNSQIKNKKEKDDANPLDYNNLAELRTTGVKCNRKGNDNHSHPLECFNELNLLDRLKYIKVYYDITGGKTDYVFPNDPTYGLPCVKEEDKTKYIANIEKFYLGYLIDRDGPVNAFAGFFEMKVKAIEESIGIKQQEIRAYNAYLDFLNRGLDMLNSSQSEGEKRISDGTIIAMTYLCGQKMYKLFTDNSGKEFLVIPSVSKASQFFLVPNDQYGMQFLLGDNGTVGAYRGNSSTNLGGEKTNDLFKACYTTGSLNDDNLVDTIIWGNTIEVKNNPNKYYTSTGTAIEIRYTSLPSKVLYAVSKKPEIVFYETKIGSIDGVFSLPAELDIEIIKPESVYKYASATSDYGDSEKDGTTSHTSWAQVIESWTSTFQTKISYIDTALKSTQTDIKTLRDTINTFETLTKTLRSRTHDAGLNVVNKLVS